jgi:DNA-binding GntR family transcriptional regulator
MIYPVNYNSTDLIKGNEIALELGVKPDSTVYQLHKLGYLDGTTLVVRGNIKP